MVHLVLFLRLDPQSMATRRFMGWLVLGGDRYTSFEQQRAIRSTDSKTFASDFWDLSCFVIMPVCRSLNSVFHVSTCRPCNHATLSAMPAVRPHLITYQSVSLELFPEMRDGMNLRDQRGGHEVRTGMCIHGRCIRCTPSLTTAIGSE